MFKKKKAQAVSAVISLVVGVGVAVLVLIFVGVLGGSAYDISEDDINAIANNVVTADGSITSNSTSLLAHGFIQNGTLSIYNTTAPFVEWGLENFTIDYDAGQIISLPLGEEGSIPQNNTVLYANYTWGAAEVRTSIQNGIINSFEALENTGNYVPLVVLGLVIFIVLGLVFGMTAFNMKGSNTGAL